jgi:hypothetical protein
MDKSVRYYNSFVQMFVFLYFFYFFLIFILRKGQVQPLSFITGASLLMLFTALINRFFYVEVREGGVRGYDFWGRYHFVDWREMEKVEHRRVLNLTFLRIFYRSGKSPLWLPLFLKKREQFSSAVARLAPEDNPLKDYLIRRAK